jgi:hypothetical protein
LDPVDDALPESVAVLPERAAERAVLELVIGASSLDAHPAAEDAAGRHRDLDRVTVGTVDPLVHPSTVRLAPDWLVNPGSVSTTC